MPEEYEIFLENTAKAIVAYPEEVQITKTKDDMGILLCIRVNQQDTGRIIGREGSTAKALRTILRVIGMKNNARVNLKILEPEGSGDPTSNPLL